MRHINGQLPEKYGGSSTAVYENADGALLKALVNGFLPGMIIVQLSKKHDCSVLFNIRKHDTNDTLLGEGIFLYDVTQGKAAYKTQVGTVFAVPTFTVSVSKIAVIIPITAR